MWTTPEAKATKDWQKQLGEKLANHLTTCGFQSHLQGDKLHFYPSIHLQKPIIYLTQSYSEGCSCQLKRVVFPIAVWSLQVKAKLNRLILDLTHLPTSARSPYHRGRVLLYSSVRRCGSTKY